MGLLFFSASGLAVWYGREGLAVLASLMLAAALFSRGWSRLSLTGVRARLLLSEWRGFPGDRIQGRLRLVNRKPLPLPWIELEQALPEGLLPSALGESGGQGAFRFAASMRWYQAVQWRIGLVCVRRGYYPLPPMSVTSGDPFGFYTRSAVRPPAAPVLVCPRLIPLDRIASPLSFPPETSDPRVGSFPTRPGPSGEGIPAGRPAPGDPLEGQRPSAEPSGEGLRGGDARRIASSLLPRPSTERPPIRTTIRVRPERRGFPGSRRCRPRGLRGPLRERAAR
jgi:uncharacterized protein (DUF58 family)